VISFRKPIRRADLCLLLLFFLGEATVALAQVARRTPEERATRYLESVRNQPGLALAFLRDMPKGGDLHNHLGGAVYAEDLIDYAARDKLCIDRSTMTAVSGVCDASCDSKTTNPAAECAYRDATFYNSLIDAWSMRNWERGHESGHDHFFATFLKFDLPFQKHVSDEIRRALQRASADHLQYIEFMHTIDGMRSAELGTRVGWNSDLSVMHQKLLSAGLRELVPIARKELENADVAAQESLGCGGTFASAHHDRVTELEKLREMKPGCEVQIRYLYQVLRGLPPEQVFAQIAMGFELASADPRVVGLNLVMPEDWYIPMRDFDLHMRMLDYLHNIYPRVHITLHAGELAVGLVPPEGLSFHIRHSIEQGHAERIGHGVAVMNEHNAVDLLREMAHRKILIEICLTSNDTILGVRGKDHPFPIYRKFGVPVALATDDEGVSRSDMTHEYLRAFETYSLSYSDLKQMARQSLEHSFLPGSSFWKNIDHSQPVEACKHVGAGEPSSCKKFLSENERARTQWQLEREFVEFERHF
jgi:hypothetical protein